MCLIRVAFGRCPNQACGRVCQKIDGIIDVCESREIFQRTEDATVLHNCPIAVLGAPIRMEYDAGLADDLCQKCKWRESWQLHRQRRQAEYVNQNRVPPMAMGWEQAPDWTIYQAHPDTMAPRWMLNDTNGGGGE
jgi:hypothetical protein